MSCYDMLEPYYYGKEITVDIFESILDKFHENELHENLACFVVRTKSLDCLKYLHTRYPYMLKKSLWSEAASLNLLYILEFLFEIKMEFSDYAPSLAASRGSHESLKYLLSIGSTYQSDLTFQITDMQRNEFCDPINIRRKPTPIYECLVISQLHNIPWHIHTLVHPISEIARMSHYSGIHELYIKIKYQKTNLDGNLDGNLDDGDIKKYYRQILTRMIPIWIQKDNEKRMGTSTSVRYIGALWVAFRYAYENGCPLPPENWSPHHSVLDNFTIKYAPDYVDTENTNIIQIVDTHLDKICGSLYDKNIVIIIAQYISCTPTFTRNINSYLQLHNSV